MRTLLKITVGLEAGNKAIQNGRLPQVIQSTIEKLKPEATYFLPQNGERTAILVFDLKDPSDLPAITEPLFSELNAKVEFSPVMNLEDLQKGLAGIATGKPATATAN